MCWFHCLLILSVDYRVLRLSLHGGGICILLIVCLHTCLVGSDS